MIESASTFEFYHKSVGWELHNLPDVPVIVEPLIDTTFHALADASITGPAQWVFKVRHSGGWRVRERSPRVSLYFEGGKHICFNFKITKRPLYKNISEVFEDMARGRYEMSAVNLAARCHVPMDEQQMLERFNADRAGRIRSLKLPVKVLSSDVIDFTEMRARLRPILSGEEFLNNLPLYGAG